MRNRLGGKRAFVTEEMAAAALYLAGYEAAFATGTATIVGGGRTP